MDRIRGIEAALQKPRVQFLYLHHVFKDEEKKFEELIQTLSKQHKFISYSEAVEKVLQRKIDKPYISISMDDGFKNNIKAAEILKEFNAPCCFFINPEIIGKTSHVEIETYCREKLGIRPIEFMNWNDIELLQKMGHEIGSHTMEHINVGSIDRDVFEADCKKTFEILMSRCGAAKHFAFPYGRYFHFSEEAFKTVFNVGYYSCATAERGCYINPMHNLQHDELCIMRDHIIAHWPINHSLYFLGNNARKVMANSYLHPFKS
jgi:peptidoglycan/xylan/chitin deacetylase (PgdA/CDA1 family)